MENNNKLIKGIIEQSILDSKEILKNAEKVIAEKKDTFETASKQIRKETDIKISKKLEELEKRAESAVESEKRRQLLRKREQINSEVIKVFREKIKDYIQSDEYSSFIIKLIAEGVIAVNDDNATVSASFMETISDNILRSAEKLVKEQTGKTVTIKLSENQSLTNQGIIVESSSGRIAYNNQIDSRLRRFEEDIKMIIINGLSKE